MRTELVGYLDDFNACPGKTLGLKVSTTAPTFAYRVVRLVHGDPNPSGPGFKVAPVDGIASGSAAGRLQRSQPGSFVTAPDMPELTTLSRLSIVVWVQPTLPALGRRQTIFAVGEVRSGHGLDLSIRPDGTAELLAATENGAPSSVALADPLRCGVWSRLVAALDRERGELTLAATRSPAAAADWAARRAPHGLAALPPGPIRIAAAPSSEPREAVKQQSHFNGKLGGPRMFDAAIAVGGTWSPRSPLPPIPLAAWHFGRAISTTRIEDVGPNGRHGAVVNSPTRGVTGPDWSGEVLAFAAAPDQYDAIHFHDDDLDDAGWRTDVEITLPKELPSGIYAIELSGGSATDHVPFFVGPGEQPPSRNIAVLLPTLTYLAYANERLTDEIDYEANSLVGAPIEHDRRDELLRQHPEHGKSMYDHHGDGSGVCHSSMRRPILNMRPDYRSWLTGAARHLGGDLYLTDWLEAGGFAYDVITDHMLHERGVEALAGYAVVLTGSHPEYCTGRMIDSLERFVASGSNLMYLGGNGFYWVTSIYEDRPHLAEVRRGFAGTRSWESPPGEGYHAATGEPGGLWRHRGRPPNNLTGVGFTSQGWDRSAPGYRRTRDSFDPRVRFMFEGIGEDEVIGDFGLVMGGASGDEIDRADPALGTPHGTLVVATSEGHSDHYQLAVEDVPLMTPGLGGTEDERVRSDMTYLEQPGGGAVFSVGSIAYTGALSHDDYDSNVSKLTENVLTEFLRRRPADRGARTAARAG